MPQEKRSRMRFTKIFVLVALAALVIVPAAFALRFTDDSFVTQTGETGKAYSFQFHGAGGCGPALPYQYKVLAGSLPARALTRLQRPHQRHSHHRRRVVLLGRAQRSESAVGVVVRAKFGTARVFDHDRRRTDHPAELLEPGRHEYALQRPAHRDRRGLADVVGQVWPVAGRPHAQFERAHFRHAHDRR